jgi:adenosylhomocysteine nucleosidase
VLVVVTFALDSEFAPWRRLRRFRRGDGPDPVYESRIGSVDLRVVLIGIGQHAAATAAAVVFRDQPDLCIASGLAGGLDETLRVADVVAPLRVRAPGGGSIDCDASVVARALRCGARRITALYSAQAIVVTAAEKRRLSARADAVDMESWAILSESRQRGIPGVAIRAISDPADVDLPLDLNRAVSPHGELNWGGVLAAMARRPTAVPGVVRLGVLGHRAATALSVFLDAYMERLAGSD